MLWSFSELVGFGGGGADGSLGGTGVELRLTAQGLMESTAEAQVDLSALLSEGGAEAMVVFALACRVGEAPKEDQLLDDEGKRLGGRGRRIRRRGDKDRARSNKFYTSNTPYLGETRFALGLHTRLKVMIRGFRCANLGTRADDCGQADERWVFLCWR